MDIHDNFSKRKSSLLFEQWHREQCRSLDVMGAVLGGTGHGQVSPGIEEGEGGVIHGNQSTRPQSSLNERRED